MEFLLWAREDAKERWAKSQSYNLYRKINYFYSLPFLSRKRAFGKLAGVLITHELTGKRSTISLRCTQIPCEINSPV
jgi:hypothetical protein